MSLLPQPGFIIVEKILPGKTPGGLHVPETVQDDLPRARVLKGGKGEPLMNGGNREPEVMEGDIILVGGARQIPYKNNKNLFIVPMHEIVATIGPEDVN